MLKNTPKILSPELLKVLAEMGHGETIIIADANFPALTVNAKHIIRADGLSATDMLDAMLKVIPLDTFVNDNVVMMAVPEGTATPTIWKEYEEICKKNDGNEKIVHLERFKFYDKAKDAVAVVYTGESRIYANVIIQKGVIQ